MSPVETKIVAYEPLKKFATENLCKVGLPPLTLKQLLPY